VSSSRCPLITSSPSSRMPSALATGTDGRRATTAIGRPIRAREGPVLGRVLRVGVDDRGFPALGSFLTDFCRSRVTALRRRSTSAVFSGS
jgi:hypothetical protein